MNRLRKSVFLRQNASLSGKKSASKIVLTNKLACMWPDCEVCTLKLIMMSVEADALRAFLLTRGASGAEIAIACAHRVAGLLRSPFDCQTKSLFYRAAASSDRRFVPRDSSIFFWPTSSFVTRWLYFSLLATRRVLRKAIFLRLRSLPSSPTPPPLFLHESIASSGIFWFASFQSALYLSPVVSHR